MKAQPRNRQITRPRGRTQPEAVVALAYGVPSLDRTRTLDS